MKTHSKFNRTRAELARAARALTLGATLTAAAGARAQQAQDAGSEADLFALDAELEQQTQVAGQQSRSVRESPGVVTVLTREDILGAGARDLVDVLDLVPGMFVGTDVQGLPGVVFRGNWAHEGKVLVLLDGQELNETLYGTAPLLDRVPVEHIQKVEVIRGAGSATYGGYAELGVINIVTRTADELEGAQVSAGWGQRAQGWGRRGVSLQAAHTFAGVPGLSASLAARVGQAQVSEREATDLDGGTTPLLGRASTEPLLADLGVRYGGLQLRLLYERASLTTPVGYNELLATPVTVAFGGLYAELRHDLALSPTVSVTSRLNYQTQEPWQDLAEGDYYFNARAQRLRARVSAGWQPLAALHLAAGLDGWLDHARVNGPLGGINVALSPSSRSVQYTNVAGFVEAAADLPWLTVVAGARAEHHSQAGTAFVPRLALTRAWERVHLKALYTRAFRPPTIKNLSLSPDVEAEHSVAYEVEAGWQALDALYLGANVFDNAIQGPIVYTLDEVAMTERYANFERTGSAGVEVEARLRGGWGSARLAYSYARAKFTEGDVPVYTVGGRPELHLGLPEHRLTATASVRLLPQVSLAPTVHLFSQRWAVVGYAGDGTPTHAALPADALVHLFVRYERAFQVDGLELSAGVYNVLGRDFHYAQAYDGGDLPVPAEDREVLLRATYTLPF